MLIPSAHDTIVAVSTAWQASPVGVVRLSGPAARAMVERLGIAGAPWPERGPGRIIGCVPFEDGALPAELLCFAAPRSYTGQDVVEIHTVGAPPLLRHMCDQLIALGARRALPGEFTARAFLSGRLQPEQVDGVLATLRAADETDARQAARMARGEATQRHAAIAAGVANLLAAVEAGIDFADEEDVRFITPAQARETIERLLALVPPDTAPRIAELRAARSHVALAGLPNAGKSALFNALVGRERAIVSPVIGTTRDVLVSELTLGAHTVMLQDCAGLGADVDALALAAHRAAERTADEADVVLWVHAADVPWTPSEQAACERVAAGRRLLVISKCDAVPPAAAADMMRAAPVAFCSATSASALTGEGLDALRSALAAFLDARGGSPRGEATAASDLGPTVAALRRAHALAGDTGETLMQPELVALELRTAYELVSDASAPPADEAILARVFAEFCVGK